MLKSISKISIVACLLSANLSAFGGLGDIGGKIGSSINIGDVLNGITNFDFNTINKIIKNQKTGQSFKFGNNFLYGQCQVPDLSDFGFDGISGICGGTAKILTKGANKILDILRDGVDLGVCTVGVDMGSVCEDNFLTNFCKNIDGATQEIAAKAGEEFSKMQEKAKQEIKKKVKEKIQDPANEILTQADKYFPMIGGDVHQKKDKSSSSSNKCMDVKRGLSDQKNIYGEKISDTMDAFSVVYSNFIDKDNGSSSAAVEVIADCLKQFPIKEFADFKNNAQAKEKLKFYYDICSPANQERPSQSEIFENRIKTARQLSKTTSPSFAKSTTVGSEITKDLVSGATGCFDKKTLAEALECQQIYFTNTKNGKSGISTAKALESNYIKTAEEASALTLSAIESIYKDEIVDTSQEALKQLPPNKRGYFLAQAKKQDMQAALFYSYMNKITEAKKELARISFAKIKECAVPFYSTAVLNEIGEMVKDAKKEAQDVVNQILGG